MRDCNIHIRDLKLIKTVGIKDFDSFPFPPKSQFCRGRWRRNISEILEMRKLCHPRSLEAKCV